MEAITRNNALIEELIRTMRGGAGGNINNGEAPQPQPQPQQVNNEAIIRICEALVSSNSSKGDFIKRDYKLTKEGSLHLWIDQLESELWAKGLKERIIEGRPDDINKDRMARDLIIARLDPHYQNQVIQQTDPCILLQEVKRVKGSEMNLNSTALRVKFNNLRIGLGEKVQEFRARFDEVVGLFNIIQEECPEEVILSERAKVDQAMAGTSKVYPGARLRALGKGGSAKVSLNDYFSFLLQEEADIGANTTAPKKETAQALVIRHKKRRVFTRTGPVNGKVGVRCFKCGDRGHFAKACKNAGKKCYTCEEFGHISPECPKNKTGEKDKPKDKFKKRTPKTGVYNKK